MPRLKRVTIPGEQPGNLFDKDERRSDAGGEDQSGERSRERPLADRMRPRTTGERFSRRLRPAPVSEHRPSVNVHFCSCK